MRGSTGAEIVGGVLSNSLAIATDAVHLLTDFASFLISLFAIWMAAKPKSQKMSFGWHRAEVLGATASVLLIWLVTGGIVYMAIQRVKNQDFVLDATAMLITSGLGVGVNLVMGATLHQHGHSHGGGASHGHSHGGGAAGDGGEDGGKHGEKTERENINVKAAYIHVLGDLIQSVGVFIAAIVIYFKPEWTMIDPICTFIFSLLVLATTITILRKTLHVLLEATPSNINYDIVMSTFLSVKGIRQIHSLRIWGLTTEKNALSAHLVVEEGINAQEVLQEASKKIRSQYDFYEMTLQIEEFHEEMTSCDQCKDPVP
jgi:zinc transporter 2